MFQVAVAALVQAGLLKVSRSEPLRHSATSRFYEDDEFLDLLDEIQGERNLPIYVFTAWLPERTRDEAARQRSPQKPVATV